MTGPPELHHDRPPYPPAWRRLELRHVTDPPWPRPDAERWPWLMPHKWEHPIGWFAAFIEAGEQ